MLTHKNLTLDDLLAMNNAQLFEIMKNGHPIAAGSLDNTRYTGVDISLPKIANKILWKSFQKTFFRDPATGDLRGWNVRVKQTGWDAPTVPMTDKTGKAITFGHYRLRSTHGFTFPKGWSGPDFLDYGTAGNLWFDVARFAHAPLVAVNAGSSQLLLGWEVIVLGSVKIPLPDYWALRYEGPLTDIVAVPKP